MMQTFETLQFAQRVYIAALASGDLNIASLASSEMPMWRWSQVQDIVSVVGRIADLAQAVVRAL